MQTKTMNRATAEQLLAEYKAGTSFFLASPRHTLLAQGMAAVVPTTGYENEKAQIIDHIKQVLKRVKQQGISNHPIAVGAIPFDHLYPAQLVVPSEVEWAGPLSFGQWKVPIEQQVDQEYEVTPIPSPEGYKDAVEQGLQRIKAGDLRKIVLSRSLQLTSAQKVDIPRLLRQLAVHNPTGYTFAMALPDRVGRTDEVTHEITGNRTLVGASPELLVAKSGMQVIANPLAGSAPRSNDPEEDRRRAQELLSSEKNRHEHAVVIEAVANALRPFCKTLDVPEEPSLIHTETMWHLSTVIRGELSSSSITSLDLAFALHPTPAVCGTPTPVAKQAIQEIEPFERGFFTGMVGWCNEEGDGEWIVTIRCAEIEDRTLRLFAGAGVVEGSKPEEELAETSAKFRTMLLAMGLHDDILK
ncbi:MULTISPECIES: isochorismate synthase DhbC [Geobacillus]|jgi:isochorismate synthase|uniref:isochorismate synthase DhbC n=1 Tax=Geobacillus TaxID=129337 RepID=UPI00042A3808|nr:MULTISPECIES: isochorismate synthase DhbC [Geobacillus]ARA98009.1 isochorismate synthase [Geobacillus thermodenitrificans]ARP41191.1 Vibriobactin-specific isochorismate synthase [Geobacillus thermodenitrificans]ATO37363.1 isochorismate synthase [Geobacillus thermodenitrificans]KQB94806.1 Isochorismate synthase DhbC [Geobacillus sp. PA-3]MED0664545.1 isochorismate synthase [Geobacillus thermodenitrificans]